MVGWSVSDPCWGNWGWRISFQSNLVRSHSEHPSMLVSSSTGLLRHGLLTVWRWGQLDFSRRNWLPQSRAQVDAVRLLRNLGTKFENVISAAFFWPFKSPRSDQIPGDGD